MMRLALFFILAAGEVAFAADCRSDRPYHPRSPSMFEDPGARMGLEQVLALPDEAFEAFHGPYMSGDYTHSAFWIRFSLAGMAERDCVRWLTVGDPRLSDIQVFIQQGDGWRRMHAGSAHPPDEWPVLARQPLFPLGTHDDGTVLIRAMSRAHVVVEPLLWSEPAIVMQRQRSSLVDGLTLGVVLLLVPFSLIVGGIMRSPLLLTHAAAVFSYILFTCVVNGYLVHWPALLPWTPSIRSLASAISFACLLGYARVLLQVRLLPRAWGLLYSGFLALFVVSHLWTLLIDHVQGRELAVWVMGLAVYLALPVTLLVGWYRGLSHVWMAWAVPALYLIQFVFRHVLEAEQVMWQSRLDFFNLSSTMPGVVMLSCTLITELYRSRARERWAQAELDGRRQAEQARLESTVARRTEQLRESLLARSALLARISHDLRAPLMDIIDHARALQARTRHGHAHRIERNARRQLDLIDELLELSRGDLAHNESRDLHAFLREIGEETELLAGRQNNRFELCLAADVPRVVNTDFRRLRRVLVNLLGNSAKFTRDGRIGLAVTCVERTVESARLHFRIDDSGIGIHPDDRERLLRPFERGRNVERIDGSGLGLAIVAQTLQAMGSVLHLESDGRAGSRFGFELSLAPVDEKQSAPLESPA